MGICRELPAYSKFISAKSGEKQLKNFDITNRHENSMWRGCGSRTGNCLLCAVAALHSARWQKSPER